MSRRKTDVSSNINADEERKKKVVSPILDVPRGKLHVHPVGENIDDATEPFKALAPRLAEHRGGSRARASTAWALACLMSSQLRGDSLSLAQICSAWKNV